MLCGKPLAASVNFKFVELSLPYFSFCLFDFRKDHHCLKDWVHSKILKLAGLSLMVLI